MANLRLLKIKVSDSTTVVAKFNNELDILINSSNIKITANLPSIPSSTIFDVSVIQNIIILTTQPLTPYALYTVTFSSTQSNKFKSKDGNDILLENGIVNVATILGAEDPDDPVRQFLTNTLTSQDILNLNPNSLARDIINSQANNLSKALYDIKQAKNDNYLNRTILGELHTRGAGPYDRLNEEGAYEILRVSLDIIPKTISGSISFNSMPDGPVTLQAISVVKETLLPGTGIGTFDQLILTAKNIQVTKLNQVTIKYANNNIFNYDITVYGYQILNTRYDTNYASPLLTLDNNQFKLNDNILSAPGFIMPQGGDQISISYEYKNLGRNIDENTVEVSQVLNSTREVISPLLNKFSLQFAPVVTSGDTIATSAGIIFYDPLANPPFSTIHKAFIKELPFRLDRLPANSGEYSVDYTLGIVYVYGETTNDGSGNYPPYATYQYRNIFVNGLDYVYDADFSEIAASPIRSLEGEIVKISFNYEDNFIPGIDFNSQIHSEVLDERVDNRVNNTNSLNTLHSPITSAFRIYNETSGEIYKIQRWNNNTIFYTFNTPPKVVSISRERASFTNVTNETLIVNDTLANIHSSIIYKILLQNNTIMAASEDVIGASFNSSVTFSRSDIFTQELYFDDQILDLSLKLNRLLSAGQYLIDYINGIIYLCVNNSQNYDIGTTNYKKSTITTQNKHIVSVSSIYNSISTLAGINKNIILSSFSDTEITPGVFDVANERFLHNDITLPYIVDSNTITVSDDIDTVRGIYDAYDLNNNILPTNFEYGSIISSNKIILGSVIKTELLTINSGLILNATNISPGSNIISITSIVRVSDNVSLLDSSVIFSNFTITLSGLTGSPVVGQQVIVTYNVALNGGATPIVDYSRGEYFVDYIYLADEILISYEYGNNQLDFRQNNNTILPGTIYYVDYKVGALRSALLSNFGTLVDIPSLNVFDTSIPRESYRDALTAALQSFTKGPTIPAIKSIISNITHIEPEIIESTFQGWALGSSYLTQNDIDWSDNLLLLPAKYDNGALLDQPGENINFPVSSNLRLEEGTLETWVIPEWDGLDNDATLTFSNILKSGNVLSSSNIFIGADSHNPIIDNNQFSVNRKDTDSPIGLPSAIFTKTGLFVYYDQTNKYWKILVKDTSVDGYAYQGTIISSGEVYDVKHIPGLGEINDTIQSGKSKINFIFNVDSSGDGYDGYYDGYLKDGYQKGYSFNGIQLMADNDHYIFDFGSDDATNRFSIYKDGSGFLNFRVYDNGNKNTKRKDQYKVSADISAWKAGQKHHIATSWRLNSQDNRDEMHLFIDGIETPNVLRFGGIPLSTINDRFRIIKPEIVSNIIPNNIINGNDLITTAGSKIVTSLTVNFTIQGIVPGNQIQINELNFGTFTITSVNNFSLTLNTNMPTSLNNVNFSVNPYSIIVSTDITLYNNIKVSVIRNNAEIELTGVRGILPDYSIGTNALNQYVLTILGNAMAGDVIAIRTLGLNHRRVRERQFLWGSLSNVIKTQLPPPINLDTVNITQVILPAQPIGPSNSIYSSGLFNAQIFINQLNYSPNGYTSNHIEGRTLNININDNNVDFTTPVQVVISGTKTSGAVVETLTFTSAGNKNTINKFCTITFVTIIVKPYISTKNSTTIEIKEAYSITYSEGNSIYPVLRFSYKTQIGSTLTGAGNTNIVSDNNGYFLESFVGQTIVITSPISAAGSYIISEVTNSTTIVLNSNILTPFVNGTYSIYNTSLGRSGFANGFFVLEQAGKTPATPFLLNQGFFDFDFASYLKISLDPIGNQLAKVGCDYHNNKQANAIIDEFVILSTKLTDVRVGETLSPGDRSITTDFTSIKPLISDQNTLMLLHLDSFPLQNSADFWVFFQKNYLQSDNSVNSNFGKSLVITDKPLVIDNAGLLSTASEGSIEFWISPKYDTYNDPVKRYYFDASSSIEENVISITNGTVKLNSKVASVTSVRLQTDKQNNLTNYFAGGSISSDFQTINLGQALPYQQTPVKITYMPAGLVGNRISIYKDEFGFINFEVLSNNNSFKITKPIFWSGGSWHRVMATYKFNRPDQLDEINLFVDGEESNQILFGQNILFSQNIFFSQGLSGTSSAHITDDINFNDPINQFVIGGDFLKSNTAYARIDNLRLSDIFRQPSTIAGQPIDINYNSNTSLAMPVITDAFTTYLLDFETLSFKNTDFAIIRDETFGIFNFTANIIDSFGIVIGNSHLTKVIEDLINSLKPAQSKATLNYLA